MRRVVIRVMFGVWLVVLVSASLWVWGRYQQNWGDGYTLRRELTALRPFSPDDRTARTEELVAHYLNKMTPAAMLTAMETEYCHLDAHSLGKILFQRTGFMTAITVCGDRCTGGCLHGVLMELGAAEESAGANTQYSERELLKKPEALCDLLAKKGVNEYLCSHGLGHMFTFTNPKDHTIEAGLSHCEKFTDWFRRLHCQHGVFMEMVYFAPVAQTLDPQKLLLHPCENYHGMFPSMCYRYRAAWLYRQSKDKAAIVPKMQAACFSLTGRQHSGCAHGYGFAQTGVVAQTPRALGTICAWESIDAQRMCIDGALTLLLDSPLPDRITACNSLRSERDYCVSIIQPPAAAGLFAGGRDHNYMLYLPEGVQTHVKEN